MMMMMMIRCISVVREFGIDRSSMGRVNGAVG